MSKLMKLGLLLTIVFALAFGSNAEETKTNAEAKKEMKNQTHCPVMGGKIDSTVYTDIQGQRVYHCCPACTASLKKDPDKYFKEAAEQGILFENIQTTCPVSGHELKDKTHELMFEGRRLYFCGEDCITAFKKEPQKYLKAMDAEKAEAMDMKHEGHDH